MNDTPFTLAVAPGTARSVAGSRTSGTALHDDGYVNEWINHARRNASLEAMLVPLDAIDGWQRNPLDGNICHRTGRFFSVIGIHCRHRVERNELEWDQPIIEQPETGILGILARTVNGTLHFCLQAKVEPGNIGTIQLSPTVQATYSNYTGAHGGTTPLFLEHFMSPPGSRLLFARMQSEDGGRFMYKSNRNMIVLADEGLPVDLPEGFIWLTLQQIAGLIQRGNLVNACVRSILSGLVSVVSVTSATPGTSCCEELRDALQWLDDRRAANHMQSRRIGLNDLREWGIDDKGFFSHREQRFFRVVGLRVSSEGREVGRWGQPIIENASPGIIGLLTRNGLNGRELLMQAKAEAGNRNTIQLGPTVQFTQGNYEGSFKLHKPFLYDEFSRPASCAVLHESRQTEEGARFFREHHLHRVLMLPDGAKLDIPADYRWFSLEHVGFMLHLGEQVNSCARSILACLL